MIREKEYATRRKKLGDKLSKNSLCVLFSAQPKSRSNDTEFPYRQQSDFYYLTGFKEDNASLVLIKEKKKVKTLLFVQKKEKALELWTGKRLGTKKAKKLFAVDEVYESEEFETKIKELLSTTKRLYVEKTRQDAKVHKLLSLGAKVSELYDAAPLVHAMRLYKSKAEIALIKKAICITKEAHHKAMAISKAGKFEYELQAEIEYIFKKNGAYSDAYTSIVASGNSANTLHYISNDKKIKEESLILIDAGCEYAYYASDITRTIPASGKFSEAQKELYEMVLDVQLKILDAIKPHAMRSELQSMACSLLTKGILRLGIVKGKYKKLMKQEAYKKYYPHGIGHWMGLDVHDEAPYKDTKGKEIPLGAGMVLTIEPGIYCDKNDKSIPKRFRGIGIRIEDDILITKKGCKNLSKKIAKSVEEIEALYEKA